MNASKLLIVALAFGLQARASISISLEPAAQSTSVGSSVFMDLVVSGLGDHASPSLGAFAFALSYNPSVISAVSVGFGDQLDLGIFGSLRSSDLSTPGTVYLDEISFESASDLLASQPASFTLATLGFSSIGAGISPINFDSASLSDETGAVSLPFQTTAGQVQVTGGGVATVPDAGPSAFLLALGLLSLVAFPRRP
jgi:hypothetical protein